MTAAGSPDASTVSAERRIGTVAPALRRRGVLVSSFVWLLFVANFSALSIQGSDEQVQYTFVRRIFGDAHHAVGYYFGLGLVEAPLYALGKAFDELGLHRVSGHPVEQSVIALGLGLITLVAWPLLGAVMHGLGVEHRGASILAAALGTPFFYYATFAPAKNHALDGVLFTVAIFLTYRYLCRPSSETWLPFSIGAVFGIAYTIRYFNGAEAVVLILMLVVWRRFRDAAEIAATSAVVCLALFAIPHALHVSVFAGGNFSADNVLTFAPLNPLRMLFTDHRGYLVWSPVSALAAVGLVHLFRTRPKHRRFLVALVGMAAGVITSYALIPFWDGTLAFGQRFYTPLFPVVAIGLAGALDLTERTGFLFASFTTAWSLFLCFNFVTIGGPQYLNTTAGGASDLALVPVRTHTGLGAYGFGIWHKSNLLRPVFAWPFGARHGVAARGGVKPSSAW